MVISKLLAERAQGGSYERVATVRAGDTAAWTALNERCAPGRYRVECHGPKGHLLGLIACEVASVGGGLQTVRRKVQKDYRTPSATTVRTKALEQRIKALDQLVSDRLAQMHEAQRLCEHFATVALRLDQEVTRLTEVGHQHIEAIDALQQVSGWRLERLDRTEISRSITIHDTMRAALVKAAPAFAKAAPVPTRRTPRVLPPEVRQAVATTVQAVADPPRITLPSLPSSPPPSNNYYMRRTRWELFKFQEGIGIPKGYRFLETPDGSWCIVPRGRYEGYVKGTYGEGIPCYRQSKKP